MSEKTHAQRLWERGEEEALLAFGNLPPRPPKVANVRVNVKPRRHRLETWEQGDDGHWRMI